MRRQPITKQPHQTTKGVLDENKIYGARLKRGNTYLYRNTCHLQQHFFSQLERQVSPASTKLRFRFDVCVLEVLQTENACRRSIDETSIADGRNYSN